MQQSIWVNGLNRKIKLQIRKMNLKKKLFILVFILLNIYGLLCGVIYFFQENLIFMPSVLSKNHVFKMKSSFDEINLKSSDGAHLNGLYFKKEISKGVVLYFHGNAGNLQDWGQIADLFIDLDYDVLIMDYRGYGKSKGEKSMEFLYEDAELWYEFAQQNYSESKIIVYGRSIGTTFAAYVAAKHEPNKLILEAPFYSMLAIAKSRFSFLPIRYLLDYKFPTYQFMDDINCPVIFYHGTYDKVIPYDQGKKLYDSFNTDKKELITIPMGGHNNLNSFKEYTESISLEL